MNIEKRESRFLSIVLVVVLSVAGIVCAMALIKLFGDGVCYTVLALFATLALYAWRRTDTQARP
ncbi:hypothetical protein [Paraburkholderia sediminicola]|uniref:hypothetical protein n=1 Tax=Paraburkholderia sediminicola TaxID=458836 RepID=UPI0038B8633D